MANMAFDLSPLKNRLTESLESLALDIHKGLNTLNTNSCSVLSELKELKDKFEEVETMAASYFLNHYLCPYTSKYLEISTCLQHLSHKRQGALIVIERMDPVLDLIRNGTPIGGALTEQLLESLFYPGNPLHDGAVLIKKDIIHSAANVLPLSSQFSGGKKLGTRHRAALGLSERCDALVLVVSEETGIISFAIDGSLHPISATSSTI